TYVTWQKTGQSADATFATPGCLSWQPFSASGLIMCAPESNGCGGTVDSGLPPDDVCRPYGQSYSCGGGGTAGVCGGGHYEQQCIGGTCCVQEPCDDPNNWGELSAADGGCNPDWCYLTYGDVLVGCNITSCEAKGKNCGTIDNG